jgi:signal transduction histidine kinase
MEGGLVSALTAAAKRSTLPMTEEVGSLGRYPTDVEATVYFCCMEAIQNACKYAGESATITVRVAENEGSVGFAVVDDGAGFVTRTGEVGAGFLNMSDRLCALGGSVRVESEPGRGTLVAGTVPLERGPDR